MFKSAFATLLLLIATACSCATAPIRPSPDAVVQMMDSTVRIAVKAAGVVSVDVAGVEVEVGRDEITWSGSGVVVDKSWGVFGSFFDGGNIHTTIVTAQHVLVALGEEIELPGGKMKVDTLQILAVSNSGESCSVVRMVPGGEDSQDVAVIEVDCDLGRTASLGSELEVGSLVQVVGHPFNIQEAVTTEGYFSGMKDGYLALSAPAAPGNSGGGVWFEGRLVGILVRVNGAASHLSLACTLDEIRKRLVEADE